MYTEGYNLLKWNASLISVFTDVITWPSLRILGQRKPQREVRNFKMSVVGLTSLGRCGAGAIRSSVGMVVCFLLITTKCIQLNLNNAMGEIVIRRAFEIPLDSEADILRSSQLVCQLNQPSQIVVYQGNSSCVNLLGVGFIF